MLVMNAIDKYCPGTSKDQQIKIISNWSTLERQFLKWYYIVNIDGYTDCKCFFLFIGNDHKIYWLNTKLYMIHHVKLYRRGWPSSLLKFQSEFEMNFKDRQNFAVQW
jgi:hypothetical protein